MASLVEQEVLQPGSVAVDRRDRLDELAGMVTREYDAALAAAETALVHAIRCGDGLARARAELPSHREWLAWVLADTPFTSSTNAHQYLRLARHRQAVLDSDATSVIQADRVIKSLRDVFRAERDREATQLRDEGLTLAEIAEALGVAQSTAHRMLNRVHYGQLVRRRRKERRLADQAWRKRQRDESIKRALVKEGQAFNEVYSLVTRLDGLLGRAREEAQSKEKRLAINEAHALRDKIMNVLTTQAMGIE